MFASKQASEKPKAAGDFLTNYHLHQIFRRNFSVDPFHHLNDFI